MSKIQGVLEILKIFIQEDEVYIPHPYTQARKHTYSLYGRRVKWRTEELQVS